MCRLYCWFLLPRLGLFFLSNLLASPTLLSRGGFLFSISEYGSPLHFWAGVIYIFCFGCGYCFMQMGFKKRDQFLHIGFERCLSGFQINYGREILILGVVHLYGSYIMCGYYLYHHSLLVWSSCLATYCFSWI